MCQVLSVHLFAAQYAIRYNSNWYQFFGCARSLPFHRSRQSLCGVVVAESWRDAEISCQRDMRDTSGSYLAGGHLVDVQSLAEQEFLAMQMCIRAVTGATSPFLTHASCTVQ